MKTANRLLDAANAIWEQYYTHPFVMGIQDGTLCKEKFRYYLIQDHYYLQDYAKIFAIGVAKARNAESAKLFAKYIAVMNGELDIHSSYLTKMGITEEEISSTPRSLDNLSYTSYMLRVAYEEGEAEILAAILPCAYSYTLIAQNIATQHPASVEHEFYGDWIKGYSSEPFMEDSQVLLKMLNHLTEHYSEDQINHLADIFVACSRYEYLFWEMAWNLRK